ncbi:MAG TPA: serine hydrolase domain-containing protein [Bryobacteraceae bacterium]|nr:serine hydrolase domain-containing protein [Bryobacteraceae bacterium]
MLLRFAALLATFLALFPAALEAASPVPLNAGKAGLDPERLALIPARMKQLVDQHLGAGVVTLVIRHGVVGEFDAVGWQDIEAHTLMRTDSIFQIMSMTKPITAVGVMMLVEEGKLGLHEPVEKYLPEFRGQMLMAARNPDGTVLLKKPSRPIVIRDLMTHTSGLPGAPPPGMKELDQKMDHTLAEAVLAYSQMPLEFEPGTKWQYSNSGIAVLGRLIEVTADEPYERFISERILQPLGMKDSFYFPPPDKTDRIAMVYRHQNGKLVRAGAEILGGDPALYRKGAKYPAPEFGLYSTAEDLSHFYQMMLNGGTYNGRRYLSRQAVDLMREVHTGNIAPAGWIPLGGSGYGLAWEVMRDPISQLMMMPAGTYGHDGAFGTKGWIDPKDDLIRVMMIQGANGTDDFRDAFMQIAGSAVVD